MNHYTFSIFLYPYPYQTATFIMTVLIILAIGLPVYGLYRLIIRKMRAGIKSTFNGLLKVTGIVILVIFFTEITISLITIHQVNKQLGFGYATPDTPEGELFLISKVVTGKTMHKAGLKPGDQVQMRGTSQLYELLINNQGGEAVIPVLRNNEEIFVRVRVPELEVPLKDVAFLF